MDNDLWRNPCRDKQGRRANQAGAHNRQATAGVLDALGWREVPAVDPGGGPPDPLRYFRRGCLESLDELIRSGQAPVYVPGLAVAISIYRSPFIADFVLQAPAWEAPLVLMCRTQTVGGSALEKLHYLYSNLARQVSQRSLILLDGAAYGTVVFDEANRFVRQTRGHIARIFRGLTEFRSWLTAGAPWPDPPPAGPDLPGF